MENDEGNEIALINRKYVLTGDALTIIHYIDKYLRRKFLMREKYTYTNKQTDILLHFNKGTKKYVREYSTLATREKNVNWKFYRVFSRRSGIFYC